MSDIAYPWSEGDRLLARNTYFYTPSIGWPMIDAWRYSRNQLLERLPMPIPESQMEVTPPPPDMPPFITTEVLGWLWGTVNHSANAIAREWVDRLVRKFETTKRLHYAYDATFNAKDREAYYDMSAYIRFANILIVLYDRDAHLPYLNCLLKVMDTLCGSIDRLSGEEQMRMAWLIHEESRIIEILAGQ